MKNLWKLLTVILCLMIVLPAAALAEERVMPEPFASATYTDPYLILYPKERDENGYLLPGSTVTSYLYDESAGKMTTYATEGEFVYENKLAGLWAYLSPTLQVEIVRYDGFWSKYGERWFVADVKYDVTAEHFTQHTWYVEDVTGLELMGKLQKNGITRGDFKDQQIWPKTLAQGDRMVLAVNGDYYHNRVKAKTTGNIVRQGEVIYNISNGSGYPNLECAAFFPDGSMKVYDAKETTATALQEQGAENVVSFGPWLVRDGEVRNYTGKNDDAREPRLAIGMVEPGHLIFIDCEGRVPNIKSTGYEARGLTLNELATLMYCHGANQAINMDGGNTSVLIFMGEKLNNTGHDTYISKPRNQEELFGLGKSELVRTDWVNGEPK